MLLFGLGLALPLLGGCPARAPAPGSTPPTETEPQSPPTPAAAKPADADADASNQKAQPPTLSPVDPGKTRTDSDDPERADATTAEESGSLRPDPLREPAADPRGAATSECDGHAIGEEWKRDCNTCVCGPDGQATCTLMACGDFSGAKSPR